MDLGVISRLTNLGEINKLLHEVIAREVALDGELDKLLGKRAELERSFLLLNTPTAEASGFGLHLLHLHVLWLHCFSCYRNIHASTQ